MPPGARALLAAAAIACGPSCGNSGKLWLVNGLDAPVKISVAGQVVELAPGGLQLVNVPGGTKTVEASVPGGGGRETVEVEVPRWSGAAVYSVAGAAPLSILTAHYVPGGRDAPEPGVETLCGQRTFQRDVDFYFQEPPERLTLSTSSGAVSRRSLLLAEGGWQACVNGLLTRNRDQAAADLVAGVRAVHPTDVAVGVEAHLRGLLGDEEKALALLRTGAMKGGSREAHLAYQAYGRTIGRRQALLQEYRARAAGAPDDLELRFLVARLLPAAEAVKELRAVLERRPEDTEVRLSLTWALNQAGQFAESLRVPAELGGGARLTPQERPRAVHRRVWSLAALGRLEEAVEVVRAESQGPEPVYLPLLVQQGLLAAKLGRPDLEPSPEAIEGDRPSTPRNEWRRVLYDGQVHPERLDRARLEDLTYSRNLATLLAAAAEDPGTALAQLRRFNHYEVLLVPEPVATLLLAEAWRQGDRSAEKLLQGLLTRQNVDLPELRAHVLEGRTALDLEELWEDRGAIHLARARLLRVRGDAAAAAREEKLVRAHDVYAGAATRALESWPPATSGGRSPGLREKVLALSKRSGSKPRAPEAAPLVAPGEVEYRLVRVEGVTLEPER